MLSPIVYIVRVAATVAMLLSGPAQAATITVNTDTSGSGCTIMDAIDSANADSGLGGCAATTTGTFGDDIIILPPGNNIETLFAVDNTGAFGPTGLPVIHSKITIEGNNGFIQRLTSGVAFRLFDIASDGDLTLKDLTLKGGLSDDGNDTANSLSDSGAAIMNEGGKVTLKNCTVTANTAGVLGSSGVRGSVTMNLSTPGHSATMNVDHSRISSNIGGGISSTKQGTDTSHNSVLIVNDSAISLNTAQGIEIIDGSSFISRSEISYNQHSGITTGNNVTLSVRDSTISWNTTSRTRGGGGLAIIFGSSAPIVTVINSTLAYNQAPKAGGILHSLGTLNLVNSIVSGNSAYDTSSTGQQIRREAGSGGGSPVAGDQHNNVLGNIGMSSTEAFFGFTPGASDITATSDGTKPTPLNQIILPLSNNGGPTRAHALPPGSPALDAAVTTYSTGGLLLLGEGCAYTTLFPSFNTVFRPDQRGLKRPQNGKCDIGAYEEEETTFFVIPTSGGKTVIFGL